jgi:hypothetical protein
MHCCALKAATLLLESDPRLDTVTLRSLHTLSQEGLDFFVSHGTGGALGNEIRDVYSGLDALLGLYSLLYA